MFDNAKVKIEGGKELEKALKQLGDAKFGVKIAQKSTKAGSADMKKAVRLKVSCLGVRPVQFPARCLLATRCQRWLK